MRLYCHYSLSKIFLFCTCPWPLETTKTTFKWKIKKRKYIRQQSKKQAPLHFLQTYWFCIPRVMPLVVIAKLNYYKMDIKIMKYININMVNGLFMSMLSVLCTALYLFYVKIRIYANV